MAVDPGGKQRCNNNMIKIILANSCGTGERSFSSKLLEKLRLLVPPESANIIVDVS